MKNFTLAVFFLFCSYLSAQTITATISYQGYDESQAYFGQGEYEIFLDNVDGILDKPIILVDGFDPGDTRDLSMLYGSLDILVCNVGDGKSVPPGKETSKEWQKMFELNLQSATNVIEASKKELSKNFDFNDAIGQNIFKFRFEYALDDFETVEGTNNQKWVTYYPKHNITIVSNKKTDLIEEFKFGK